LKCKYETKIKEKEDANGKLEISLSKATKLYQEKEQKLQKLKQDISCIDAGIFYKFSLYFSNE
jgi:hypothetical protein